MTVCVGYKAMDFQDGMLMCQGREYHMGVPVTAEEGEKLHFHTNLQGTAGGDARLGANTIYVRVTAVQTEPAYGHYGFSYAKQLTVQSILDGNVDDFSFKNGRLHSFNDKPAVRRDDTLIWYKDGNWHRAHEPAYVKFIVYGDNKHAFTHREWYQDGLLHRETGPAHIPLFGAQKWYQHGKLHRKDGPAVENFFEKTFEWYQNGHLHRDGDLPAIEYGDGTKVWYQAGQRHRDGDLPALVSHFGRKEWYQYGQLHRTNGPAVQNCHYLEWHEHGVLLRKIPNNPVQ